MNKISEEFARELITIAIEHRISGIDNIIKIYKKLNYIKEEAHGE